MKFLLDFIEIYAKGIFYLWPILAALLGVVVALGLHIGRVERWRPADAIYFALVTATSLGSAVLHPTKDRSKWLTVGISFAGVLLVGVIVSIGLEAVAHAFREARGARAPIAP